MTDALRRLPAAGNRWTAWLAVRLLGVLALAHAVPYYQGQAYLDGDVHLYADYAARWSHGQLPYRDFQVEYPPGILPFLHLPRPSMQVFEIEFVALALLADLAILLLLSRYRPGALASRFWVVAPIALGPVMWVRLDVFVALLLVGGCVAMERRAYAWAGVLIMGAALLKLWPAVLIAALALTLPRLRDAARLAVGAGCSLVIAVIPLLALGAGRGLLWAFRYHSARGLEIEAVATLPIHVARLLGSAIPSPPGYGSIQFGGDRWASMAFAVTLATYLAWAGCLVVARRRRPSPTLLLLLVVAATLMTSKVLSPQYMVWALAAVALALDDVTDHARLAAWTLLAAAGTQVVFPFMFVPLVESQPAAELAVILHILLVVAFAVVAGREIRMSWQRRRYELPTAAAEGPAPALAGVSS